MTQKNMTKNSNMKLIAIESTIVAREQETLIRLAQLIENTEDFCVEACIEELENLGNLLVIKDALEKTSDWYNSEYLQESLDT